LPVIKRRNGINPTPLVDELDGVFPNTCNQVPRAFSLSGCHASSDRSAKRD